MNFRTIVASAVVLSSTAALGQEVAKTENPKLYASASCKSGEEVFVAKKDTLRCNFKTGSSDIADDPGCVTQLEPILRALQEFKTGKVMVVGFADAKGDAKKNKALSIQRASSIRKYLIDGGIGADRFSVDGFGSEAEFLLCKENTKDCDAQNRRIEIATYLCKKQKARGKR